MFQRYVISFDVRIFDGEEKRRRLSVLLREKIKLIQHKIISDTYSYMFEWRDSYHNTVFMCRGAGQYFV